MTSIKLIVTGASARAEVDGLLTSGMVGIPVTIACDGAWDGLTKSMVCRAGSIVKTILNVGGTATVAHECMVPNQTLFIGIEGRNADGTLVIPTVWARCGLIFSGATTDADPSADPTLPVWAQIDGKIGNLDELDTDAKDNLVAAVNESMTKGGGEVDPKAVQQIVEDYLAANPPTITETDPTVPAWAKAENKPEYTAEEVGALSAETLPEAINTALAQAKASGEFDGADGKSAYQYAQEGGYTGTEAEFAAKLAEEMPTALPNPNALTFTGAVTGSYDGSVPVSVEIPSGGGGGSGENWRLVNTITTTDDVSNITITQDSDGNPISLKKVSIFAKVRGNSSSLSAWCRITVNNLQNYFYSDLQNTFAATEGQDHYNRSRADFSVRSGRLMLDLLLRSLNNAASKNTLYLMANTGVFENYPDAVDAITSIRMWSASAGIGAGTELMIYGVDA